MAEINNLADLNKDPNLLMAAMNFAEKEFNAENIMFYFDKGNAAGIYPKYIDPKGQKPANINSKTTAQAKELADKDDFNNPKWKDIIKAGKTEVAKALTGDIVVFVESPEYKSYLRKEKMGDPKKAAQILGITNVKKLTEAMEAAAEGNKREAETLLGELVKSEKLIARAADMMRALEKAGLV